MKVLVIFNTVISLIVLYSFLRKLSSRYELKLYDTFWQRKPFGFYILLWERPRWICPNSGKTIFSFRWIHEKWLSDSIKGKQKYGKKPSIISAFLEGWFTKFSRLWEVCLDERSDPKSC